MTTNSNPSNKFWEAEYKLQNCLRITLQVERFVTEVEYLPGEYQPVAEYVSELLKQEYQRGQIKLIGELFQVAMAAKQRGDTRVGRYNEMTWLMQSRLAELEKETLQ